MLLRRTDPIPDVPYAVTVTRDSEDIRGARARSRLTLLRRRPSRAGDITRSRDEAGAPGARGSRSEPIRAAAMGAARRGAVTESRSLRAAK